MTIEHWQDGKLIRTEGEFDREARIKHLLKGVYQFAFEHLSKTDYLVIRQVETGIPVPEHIASDRAETRYLVNRLEAEIYSFSDEKLHFLHPSMIEVWESLLDSEE
jgi:hypothetical protein